MAAVTICSDFGAPPPTKKVCHCFHCFPIFCLLPKHLANFCFYQKQAGLVQRAQDQSWPSWENTNAEAVIALFWGSLIRDSNGQHLSSAATGLPGTIVGSLPGPPLWEKAPRGCWEWETEPPGSSPSSAMNLLSDIRQVMSPHCCLLYKMG